LIGCSGSDVYRGTWKATDAKGGRYELFFDAKTFTITKNLGEAEHYDYSQTSIEINNSIKTYGIKVKDGKAYQINFPNSSNESLGLIKDGNGRPIYTISRKDYILYEDVFKL